MGTTVSPHVVVIGAWSTGAATAHDLALRGMRVTVVERGGVASGTTGRNHCLLHSGGRYCVNDQELAAECIAENLALRRIMPGLMELNGGLFVALSEEDLAFKERLLEGCAACGIPSPRGPSRARAADGAAVESRAPRRGARPGRGVRAVPVLPGPARHRRAAGRRRPPSLAWVWQAVSGAALVLLLGLHLVANHFVIKGGLRDFAGVVSYLRNPVVLFLEVLFLVVVATHAMLGVRAIVLDVGVSDRVEAGQPGPDGRGRPDGGLRPLADLGRHSLTPFSAWLYQVALGECRACRSSKPADEPSDDLQRIWSLVAALPMQQRDAHGAEVRGGPDDRGLGATS